MRVIYLLLLLLSAAVSAKEEDRYAKVQIEAKAVAEHIYMLTGSGGNMAAVTGPQGVLLVDAQFAELAGKINAKLQEISANGKIATLVNTHHHADHVSGNKVLGQGVAIIAHQNVYQRLNADDKFDKKGLPTVLLQQPLQLTLNNVVLELIPMPVSHTDGDVVVWFKQANVLHTGDLMFAGRFPFIDLKSGGSIAGYIENTRQLIARIDDNTKVIPGHGDLTNKAGLQQSLQMMEETLALVQSYKKAGLTLEQAIAKGLGDKYKIWHWNFITEKRWIETLYQA
ncbi:MBL fold metallo-hydrolase [Rheinheimera sp. 4Y26]|uniref:MBL fold metallo-hydrolase n=1 Tax=Rheinheimera sp. 4Y26 TaxID=2977811 RepID=UPI0021B0CE7A|nr:MBL fold metallo-hydrolase [Rheinheimera sp. 4Y26]MCT6698922.1 MBL fold metallo-hydrolase [Rheinheimera sp. 4Y26]